MSSQETSFQALNEYGFIAEPTLALTRKSAGLMQVAGNLVVTGTVGAGGGAGISNPVGGVGASYKLARGTVTPASASHTVVTGLTTVVAAVASLKGAPSLTHLWSGADIGDQAGTPAAGSILIKSKKPTATGDVTPIDATTPWSAVDWIAVGT
jgi:hypothetical protein